MVRLHCCRVQVWVQVQAPASHLAITPESHSRRQWKVLIAKNQWASYLGSAPAQLGLVRLASTNTARFPVSYSRFGPLPAHLRKTCYHLCNTDLVFSCAKWNFRLTLQELVTYQSLCSFNLISDICPAFSSSCFSEVDELLDEHWAKIVPLSNYPKLCRSPAHIGFPMILQSKPSIVFWNGISDWLPDDWQQWQGLELGLKLEFCSLTNGLLRFYLLWNP